MYFSEAPQIDMQELSARSLNVLQAHYAEPKSVFSLRNSLPIIAQALPDDEQLSSYTEAFYPDGRAVASLQLRDSRPAVSQFLAHTLRDVDVSGYDAICAPREIAHVQDDTNPLPKGISHFTTMQPYSLEWPSWTYGRTTSMEMPCDAEVWRKLQRLCARTIVSRVTALEEAAGNNPSTAIANAAVRLVCTKKTAIDPSPDCQPAQVAILTAPHNLTKSYEVLRRSGHAYARGATSIAAALSNADRVAMWDSFCQEVRSDLADGVGGGDGLGEFEYGLQIHGARLALRGQRYDVGYDLASKAFEFPNVSVVALRALCTIIGRSIDATE